MLPDDLAAHGFSPWVPAFLPSPPGEALVCLEASGKQAIPALPAPQPAEPKAGVVSHSPRTPHMLNREA